MYVLVYTVRSLSVISFSIKGSDARTQVLKIQTLTTHPLIIDYFQYVVTTVKTEANSEKNSLPDRNPVIMLFPDR